MVFLPERITYYCDKIMWWGLLGIVFLLPIVMSPFHNYDAYTLPKVVFMHLVTLIILLAWLVKTLNTGFFRFVKSPLNLPILIFLFVAILATLGSINPMISIFGEFLRYEGLPAILNYALLYFIVINHLSSREQIERLVRWFLISATIISGYGILQHFGIEIEVVRAVVPKGTEIRTFSTLGNPVFLAAYLATVLPLGLSRFIDATNWPSRLFWALAVGLMGISILFTYSRGGWLAGIGGLSFSIIFLGRKMVGESKKKLAGLLAILILTFVLSILASNLLQKGGAELASRAISTFALGKGSVGSRLSIWKSTFRMILDRPFWGYGPEVFKQAFFKYRSLSFIQIEGEGTMPDRAHNELLQVTANLGLVGLAVYLWILWRLGSVGRRILRQRQNSSEHLLSVGLASACLGYLIQIQFAPSTAEVAPLFWILVGSMVVINNIQVRYPESLFKTYQIPTNRLLRLMILLLSLFLVIFLAVFLVKFFLADVYFARGMVHSQGTFYSDEALEYLEKTIALNPYQNTYRFYLGGAYSNKARETKEKYWTEEAISVYQDGIKFDPLDADIYLNLGKIYEWRGLLEGEKGMMGKAIEAYRKTVEINPYFSSAHEALALIYLYQGRYEEVISEEKEALKSRPDDPLIWYHLATAYERTGRIQLAIEAYKRVLKLDHSILAAREALDRLQ